MEALTNGVLGLGLCVCMGAGIIACCVAVLAGVALACDYFFDPWSNRTAKQTRKDVAEAVDRLAEHEFKDEPSARAALLAVCPFIEGYCSSDTAYQRFKSTMHWRYGRPEQVIHDD